MSDLHTAQVVQVHAVIGRAEGEEVTGHGAELDAAHIGLGVNHCGRSVVADAPQPHCAIVAPRHKPGRVRLRQETKAPLTTNTKFCSFIVHGNRLACRELRRLDFGSSQATAPHFVQFETNHSACTPYNLATFICQAHLMRHHVQMCICGRVHVLQLL